MDQPIEKGQRWNIYCTKSNRELVRQLLALSPEQKAYVKGWIDRGGNIGKKQ
jgi:hypothetical protein